MSREMPYIQLDLGGTPFVGTPENLELFTFSDFATLTNGVRVLNPSSRDHVFAQYNENEEVKTGAYILEPETVQRLGAIMLEYGFPARINQMVIQDCDESAYIQFIDQQANYEAEELGDFLPEGWDGTE